MLVHPCIGVLLDLRHFRNRFEHEIRVSQHRLSRGLFQHPDAGQDSGDLLPGHDIEVLQKLQFRAQLRDYRALQLQERSRRTGLAVYQPRRVTGVGEEQCNAAAHATGTDHRNQRAMAGIHRGTPRASCMLSPIGAASTQVCPSQA